MTHANQPRLEFSISGGMVDHDLKFLSETPNPINDRDRPQKIVDFVYYVSGSISSAADAESLSHVFQHSHFRRKRRNNMGS